MKDRSSSSRSSRSRRATALLVSESRDTTWTTSEPTTTVLVAGNSSGAADAGAAASMRDADREALEPGDGLSTEISTPPSKEPVRSGRVPAPTSVVPRERGQQGGGGEDAQVRVLPSPGAYPVPGPGLGEERGGDRGPADLPPRLGPSPAAAPVGDAAAATSLVVVEAEVVDEREREEAMRNRILSSAVVAQRVVAVTSEDEAAGLPPPPRSKSRRRRALLLASLALVLIVVVVAGAVVAALLTTNRSQTPGTGGNATGLNNTLSNASSGIMNWTLFGAPINLSAVDEPYSYKNSAALSEDGKVLAVPFSDRIKLYRYIVRNGTWVCMDRVLLWKLNHSAVDPGNDASGGGGSDDGYGGDETAAYSMALSFDGTRMAVSDPGFFNGTGRVHLLEYDPDRAEWVAMAGAPLEGNRSRDDGGTDRFGHAVAMSSDGTVVAIAASNYLNGDSRGLSDKGYVSVFGFRNATPVGQEWALVDRMPGISSPSQLSLALSGDGKVVAIGDVRDATAPGTVRSWACVDEDQAVGDCSRYGKDIDGTDYEDMAGSAVSLSFDGSVVAVAAPGSYECEGRPSCGNVRALEFGFEADWVQRGQMIHRGVGFGSRIQLSLDGETLAASSTDDSTEIYRFIDGVWQSALEGPIEGIFLAMSYGASMLAVERHDGTVQLIRL